MPTRQLQVGAIKNLFDEFIDRHAEAYLAAYPGIKEFSNFDKSGTVNYYIGMVWSDNFERCDTNQLRIRGSYSLTKNKLVELDVSNVDQLFSFFPGQIVAFSAEPFLKKQLAVKKFLDPMKIAPVMKKINTIEKIKLAIVSGPYMDPEHEDWTLIDGLIEQIRVTGANHVIMIGPFIDIENKLIRNQYDSSWRLFFGKLMEGLHEHECIIYLVPSMRDTLYNDLQSNYFYPQSELNVELIKLKEGARPKCQIRSVTDPSQVDLGGIYVDVTSADVLLHLRKCTSFLNPPNNVFNSLYRHTITHGIYPLYPPSPTDMAIDYPNLSKFTKLDRLGPHIIVLPTRFNTSLSNVENRVIVTIQKCSVKKHLLFIEIPKVESNEDRTISSIFEIDFKHKIVDVVEQNNIKSEIKEEPSEEINIAESGSLEVVSVKEETRQTEDVEMKSSQDLMAVE